MITKENCLEAFASREKVRLDKARKFLDAYLSTNYTGVPLKIFIWGINISTDQVSFWDLVDIIKEYKPEWKMELIKDSDSNLYIEVS